MFSIYKEAVQPFLLYLNVNTPNEEGITITTYAGETVKAKYACWVYCVYEQSKDDRLVPSQYRYLFVKEDDGNLLEVIVNNDTVPNSDVWKVMEITTGLTERKDSAKLLYPNPVNDVLTLPCQGKPARVEIHDLKGTRLFSGLLSGEGACQLYVSFLSAGVYVVSIDGKHSIIPYMPKKVYRRT